MLDWYLSTSDHYDLVIVGGGINGCALARRAAECGLGTALLEKRDFGSGITSRSTRLIHGGLRYLENFQLSLVRESLRDRERLLREFPGQVVVQPFLLPAYAEDSRSPWYLAAGLGLYRLLAGASRLPPHRRLSADEALRLLPGLDAQGLVGAFEYFDCQAVYPERLALEMALQAERAGADVRNHAGVTGFLMSGSRVVGVRIRGRSGEDELQARVVVNAAGAWVDELLALLPGARAAPLLTLVNGSHIAVAPFPGCSRHAIYREARSDRRPFFVVPWRGVCLVGTTEVPVAGSPDRMVPDARQIDYLLAEANGLFPEARLDRGSVLYAYCGSRPLLRSSRRELSRASRGHAVVDHGKRDGIQGLLTMAGGKLTTAPSFAETALRDVARRLGRQVPPPRLRPETQGLAKVSPRLSALYGSRAADVLRYLGRASDLAEPVAAGCRTARGEILFAIEREKARTLGDILIRRTGMAFDPGYEPSWARRAATVAGPALGWNQSAAESEFEGYERELARTLPRN